VFSALLAPTYSTRDLTARDVVGLVLAVGVSWDLARCRSEQHALVVAELVALAGLDSSCNTLRFTIGEGRCLDGLGRRDSSGACRRARWSGTTNSAWEDVDITVLFRTVGFPSAVIVVVFVVASIGRRGSKALWVRSHGYNGRNSSTRFVINNNIGIGLWDHCCGNRVELTFVYSIYHSKSEGKAGSHGVTLSFTGRSRL